MNIGDRVRLLRGSEEGIIRKFIDDKLVELEIEDGFSIPVLKSDVVLISVEEANIFKKAGNNSKNITSPTKNSVFHKDTIFSEQGIFMAFLPINDQKLSLHLINNTDFVIPFSLLLDNGQTINGLLGGTLNSRSEIKVHDVSMQNFEKWGSYIIQILYFKEVNTSIKDPFIRKIKFKANTFFKNKTLAPILLKETYLFQIDNEPPKLKGEQIVEKMFGEGKGENSVNDNKENIIISPSEVDLHIEKIRPDYEKMNSADILQMQIETFEKELDRAIFIGSHEITFIHGVGNGVLRNEIHRRLSKNKEIEYFKDAQKEKFGFGATFVKLK